MSTKIHATVDALGNPTGVHLTPGQAHDLEGSDELLPGIQAECVIGDKAYDAQARVIEPLSKAGKTSVIPPRSSRKDQRDYDRHLYKARHLTRELLRQAQAVPRHRHPLRQDRPQLPRRHPSGCRRHLA